VVRSDAIKQFAVSLLQARPVWRTEFIHELADRILDVSPPEQLKPVTPAPAGQQPISRAGALAETAEQGPSFNANELGFAFEENGTQSAAQNEQEAAPSQPQPRPKPMPAKKNFFGLGDTQIVLLIGMFVIECCVVFGFGIIIYLNP
jgi:hypothetical protein